jgi:hypothetical protein
MAAAVVRHKDDSKMPILRFVGTNVVRDPKVADQIKSFFVKHNVDPLS